MDKELREHFKCSGFTVYIGTNLGQAQAVCFVCGVKYGRIQPSSDSNHLYSELCIKIVCPLCIEKYDLESKILIREMKWTSLVNILNRE